MPKYSSYTKCLNSNIITTKCIAILKSAIQCANTAILISYSLLNSPKMGQAMKVCRIIQSALCVHYINIFIMYIDYIQRPEYFLRADILFSAAGMYGEYHQILQNKFQNC